MEQQVILKLGFPTQINQGLSFSSQWDMPVNHQIFKCCCISPKSEIELCGNSSHVNRKIKEEIPTDHKGQ